MAKVQSPLLGYNTNVRHKGRVFHIQTEDSGISKPHVITHLFADGGRILKSQKTSYTHLLGVDDLATQVKKLMQDQHKAMFVALRDGVYDEPAPNPASNDVAHVASEVMAQPAEQAAPRVGLQDSATQDFEDAIELDESSIIPEEASDDDVMHPTMPPAVVSPSAAPPPLATSGPRSPSVRPALGPWVAPPRSSSLTPVVEAPTTPSAPPAHKRSVPPRAPAASVRASGVAVSLPASPMHAHARVPFGGQLLSERSLDDVILAFLAEELSDGTRR
jgi:hypothetical protein